MDDQNNGFNKPVNNQPMYDGQTGQRLVSPNNNNNNNNNQLKKTILMIVAIALVAAACGGLVYIKVFKKTHVNLTKNMSVRYSGVSGNAYTTSSMVSNQFEYDESNEKLRDFYRSVVYTFDKSSGLSNGDMVKVTAKYNTELADRLVQRSKVIFYLRSRLKQIQRLHRWQLQPLIRHLMSQPSSIRYISVDMEVAHTMVMLSLQ